MDRYSSKHRARPPKPSLAQPPSPPRLTLSQAIARHSTFCDDRKISLVNRYISTIDKVSSKYSDIETLYLSNNEIRDLSCITQFAIVQKVSLTGNLIETLQQLTPLKSLKCLESLSLEGNPVTDVPIYRTFVVDFAVSLKMLDSVQVWDADRAKAKVDLQQYRRITELVVKNEEEIAKLEHIKGVTKVHHNLYQIGKISTDFPPILRLRSLMSLSWPADVNVQIADSLSAKAQTLLAENPGQDWIWAYTQCMLTQQHVLATLITECEELEGEFRKAKIEYETPIKQSKILRGTARTIRKSTPGSATVTKSIDSPQIAVKKSDFPRMSVPISLKTLQKDDLSHQLLHHSPRNIATPRHSVPYSPRNEPILRAKSSLLLKKDDEESADMRQIRMENVILREHLAELKEVRSMQESNIQSDKDTFESQVRRLTEELKTVNSDLDRCKGRLEVAKLRNSSPVEHIAGDFVGGKIGNEELILHAVKVCQRKLGKKAVKMWKINVEFKKRMRVLTAKVNQIHTSVESIVFLKEWKKALAVDRFYQHQNLIKAANFARIFIEICGKAVAKSLKIDKIRIKHGLLLIKSGFTGLISHNLAAKRLQKSSLLASQFALKQIAKRAFSLIYRYAISWKIPELEENQMIEKANNHRKCKLSAYYWGKWQEWRNRFGIKQRKQLLNAYSKYANHLISLVFNLLQTNVIDSDEKLKESLAIAERKVQFYGLNWLEEAKKAVKRRKIDAYKQSISVNFYLRSMFSRLRTAVQMSISKSQIISKVDSVFRLKTLKKATSGLSFITKYRIHIENSSQIIAKKAALRRFRGYFFSWISRFTRPMTKQQRTHREQCHRILFEWSKFAQIRRVRRQKSQISTKLFAAKFTNHLKLVLWSWRYHCAKSRKLLLLKVSVEKRRERKTVFDLFCSWRLANAEETLAKSKENVISGNYKLREALQLQANLDELTEEKTALESAVGTLKKANSELQTEFDRQKLTLKSTEKQLSDLKSKNAALEQTISSVQSSAGATKLDHYREVEKLRTVITQLSDEFQRKSAELSDTKSHFEDISHRFSLLDQASKLEIAHLSSTVSSLKAQLDEKETALLDAEKLCEVLTSELQRCELARGEDLKSHNIEISQFHETIERGTEGEIYEENEDIDEGEKRLEDLHQQQAAIRKELEIRMRKKGLARVSSPTSDGDRGFH